MNSLQVPISAFVEAKLGDRQFWGRSREALIVHVSSGMFTLVHLSGASVPVLCDSQIYSIFLSTPSLFPPLRMEAGGLYSVPSHGVWNRDKGHMFPLFWGCQRRGSW